MARLVLVCRQLEELDTPDRRSQRSAGGSS
jgi:hypothetical protein